MSEDNNKKGNVFSADDPLDINELASLNDDISPDFIEQLQNQVALNASQFTGKPVSTVNEDAELFEEVSENTKKATFDDSIDDNFIKKYKAKINKQHQADVAAKEEAEIKAKEEEAKAKEEEEKARKEAEAKAKEEEEKARKEAEAKAKEKEEQERLAAETAKQSKKKEPSPKPEVVEKIDDLTSGNIIEKPAEQEQIDYNESLDFLDDNVKYSKYVIYVDPENTDFIESLTVKERKNLINRILREQDDIALTKKRLGLVQAIIKHSIIAVITISIAIPVVYWTVNASLEASINNYRRSQTLFKTMYKDKGKIRKTQQY